MVRFGRRHVRVGSTDSVDDVAWPAPTATFCTGSFTSVHWHVPGRYRDVLSALSSWIACSLPFPSGLIRRYILGALTDKYLLQTFCSPSGRRDGEPGTGWSVLAGIARVCAFCGLPSFSVATLGEIRGHFSVHLRPGMIVGSRIAIPLVVALIGAWLRPYLVSNRLGLVRTDPYRKIVSSSRLATMFFPCWRGEIVDICLILVHPAVHRFKEKNRCFVRTSDWRESPVGPNDLGSFGGGVCIVLSVESFLQSTRGFSYVLSGLCFLLSWSLAFRWAFSDWNPDIQRI